MLKINRQRLKTFCNFFSVTLLIIIVSLGFNSCKQKNENDFIDLKDSKTVVLDSWGNGAPNLLLNIPTDYKSDLSKGPDFDVHKIIPLDTTKSARAKMGIFIGHQPNRFASRLKDSVTINKLKRDGKTWDLWYTLKNKDTIYHCERIIDGFYSDNFLSDNTGVKNLKIHIFITARNLELVNKFLDYASTLRVEKPVK